MTNRPRVKVRAIADQYHLPGERIVEFMSDTLNKGGLISIRERQNGTLIVEVYRCDEGVLVIGPKDQTETNE